MSRLLLILLCFYIPWLQAADTVQVVLHLNDPNKLQLVVNYAELIRTHSGDKAVIEVVVDGPGVSRLATIDKAGSMLDGLFKQKVSVGACSNALKNSQLTRNLLAPGVLVIEEGGSNRLVQRQVQGYAYIKI